MTPEGFFQRYAAALNTQQRSAVLHQQGPALLLAVPGSGKTTVLVTRLAYLVTCCQVDPSQILTVTYTVAATQDMRRRCSQLFGAEFAHSLTFRTINGICAHIIHRYEKTYQRTAFQLLSDERELNHLIRTLYRTISDTYLSEGDIKELRTQISYCKNSMLSPQEIEEVSCSNLRFPPLYRAYQAYLREQKQMDYDDQMVYALQILRSYPQILQQVQRQWQYFCVDEAQDTSKIQHTILHLLSSHTQNLFLVGDEDQSIYGFRAAYPKAFLEFPKRYPNAHILLMEQNYRSTPAIVQHADAMIQRNQNRYKKHMIPFRTQNIPIRHTTLTDRSQQSNYLLNIARNCQEETAILYRNHDSILPLLDLLEREGIPYQCRQMEHNFFSHFIVRDMLDILYWAFHPLDSRPFFDHFYKLNVGLRRDEIQFIQIQYKQASATSILDFLSTLPDLRPRVRENVQSLQLRLNRLPQCSSFQAIQHICENMGYGSYLEYRNADTSKLSILKALAHQNPNLDHFLQRLSQLQDVISVGGSQTPCALTLSTIHASKGLEFQHVILIDAVDGILPSVPLQPNGSPVRQEHWELLEEERRLFYVAVTRAKDTLELISCSKDYGSLAPPSTFIRQFLSEKRKKSYSVSPSVQNKAQFLPTVPVTHTIFGDGVISACDDPLITIRFADGKTRTFDLPSCLAKGLLMLSVPS